MTTVDSMEHFYCKHCRYMYEDKPILLGSHAYRCGLKSITVWDVKNPGTTITFCADRQQLLYEVSVYTVDTFLEGDESIIPP